MSAVIGHPVSHSLSPLIHQAAFEATGLDWTCVAFDVADGRAEDAVNAMRTLGLAGMSVTMPHKAAVMAALDDLSDAARALAAVNCIYWEGAHLVGDNTDGAGLLVSLRHDLACEVRNRRCVVIGAGGAARSVIAALAGGGAADIAVINRSSERAEFAALLGGGVGRIGTPDDLGRASLVINATPLGMSGTDTVAVMPAPVEAIAADAVVVDLVYHPLRTPWVDALGDRGVTVRNGVGMLVGQASLAFERWTGVAAPYDAMAAAVDAQLRGRPAEPQPGSA